MQVVVWDEKKEKITREIPCPGLIRDIHPIRGMRVLGQKILIVFNEEAHLYAIDGVPEREFMVTTTHNPEGLCAVSRTHFAVLGQIPGHVKVVHNETLEVGIIPAHSSELAAVALSHDGALLATASEKGTLIRVFLTSNNGRVAELRRGVDQVTIFSLGFNPSGTMLACTSDKGTLHVFDIPHQTTNDADAHRGSSTTGSKRLTGVPSDVGGDWAYEDSDTDAAHSMEGRRDASRGNDGRGGRWGVLGKIPFMPKYFRDTVSFASAEFASDDGPGANRQRETEEAATMGRTRLPRGTVGWPNENTIVVLGSGVEPKYERFVIVMTSDGQRICIRQAWANYLNLD